MRAGGLGIRWAEASEQKGASGKGERRVGTHIRYTPGRVTGRRADFQLVRPERHNIARANAAICREHTGFRTHDDLAAEGLREEPGAGHVIRVDVSFQDEPKPKIELLQELCIASHLFANGIDEHCVPAFRVGEQIAVGGGFGVEKLTKEHVGSLNIPI